MTSVRKINDFKVNIYAHILTILHDLFLFSSPILSSLPVLIFCSSIFSLHYPLIYPSSFLLLIISIIPITMTHPNPFNYSTPQNELIPNSDSEEGKVFYYKMKGDYHRYLAEVTHTHMYMRTCMYTYMHRHTLACKSSMSRLTHNHV